MLLRPELVDPTFWQGDHHGNILARHLEYQNINPIPVGLIYDFFLWGEVIGCPPPPLKSAQIELEEF